MTHPMFAAKFPRACALQLEPVQEGFDIEQAQEKLGPERAALLDAFLATRSVFVCDHRKDDKGNEAHCVYARDLEEFLEKGAQ